MRVDKKKLFLITCFAIISTVRGATTITADSIKPSGSGTKTTFTQNVTIAKNLTTTGNATNSGTLTVVKATALDGGLTMDTNKFTVANGTGNTTIAGTLNVTGAAALNGGLTMDTNKFTVANGTGNTVIAGTLNVTGATALNGGFTIDTNKFTVADGTGNTTIGGTLNVTSNATINGIIHNNNICMQKHIDEVSSDAVSTLSLAQDSNPQIVIWSPNWSEETGGLIAIANQISNTIQILSIDVNGNLSAINSQITSSIPLSIDWSPNGDFIAALSANNTVQTFGVNSSGTLSSELTSRPTYAGARSVKWSPHWSTTTGGLIAVINSDTRSDVQTFGVDTNGVISPEISAKTINSEPVSISWSPNWSATTGGLIAITNNGTNKTIQTFGVSTDGILSDEIDSHAISDFSPQSITWSPSGSFIAITNQTSQNTIKIFGIDASGNIVNEVSTLAVESGLITDIAWSPTWSPLTGGFIAALNNDGENGNTVNIFTLDTDGTTLTLYKTLTAGNNPESVAWSPTGDFIAVITYGSNNAKIFSPGTGDRLTISQSGIKFNDYWIPWRNLINNLA